MVGVNVRNVGEGISSVESSNFPVGQKLLRNVKTVLMLKNKAQINEPHRHKSQDMKDRANSPTTMAENHGT